MWTMVLPAVAVLQPCWTEPPSATVPSSYHHFMKASNQNKFQLVKLHCLEGEIPPVHYNPILSPTFPQVRLHNTHDTWILRLFFMTFHIPTETLSEFSHIYDKKENPEQRSLQNPNPHKTKAGMLLEFHFPSGKSQRCVSISILCLFG